MSRTIGTCMTRSPHTIGWNQPLAEAHAKMRSFGVRHLPVLRNGDLVGVVSQRDLLLVETLKDVDPNTVAVEEAMAPETYTVQKDEPVERVVEAMADHRYGCAVVLDGEDVAGIFTTVDALQLLADLLAERKAPRARREGMRARAEARHETRQRQASPKSAHELEP
jgi:acetoin utilization protein AcuB